MRRLLGLALAGALALASAAAASVGGGAIVHEGAPGRTMRAPASSSAIPLVAVGSQTTAAYSFNEGSSWSSTTIPAPSTSWASVTWTGTAYLAVDNGATSQVAVSVNGTSWALATTIPKFVSGAGIATNGNGTTVVGVTASPWAYYTTNNGATWNAASGLTGVSSRCAWSAGASKFVCYGENQFIRSSPTGATWTETDSGTVPNGGRTHGAVWVGSFGVYSEAITSTVYKITNALAFSQSSSSLVLARYATNGTTIVGVANSSGNAEYGTNGVNWSAPSRDSGFTNATGFVDVLWTGKNFLALDNGAGSRNTYRTSDGTSWGTLSNTLPVGTWLGLAAPRLRDQ